MCVCTCVCHVLSVSAVGWIVVVSVHVCAGLWLYLYMCVPCVVCICSGLDVIPYGEFDYYALSKYYYSIDNL